MRAAQTPQKFDQDWRWEGDLKPMIKVVVAVMRRWVVAIAATMRAVR